MTLVLFRLASVLCPRIPAWLGHRLAGWAGELIYRLNARSAEAVCDNICHILATRDGKSADEAQIEKIARQVFCNLFKNYYDMFRLAAMDVQQAVCGVEADGWEHIEAAQALGRGVVLASAHYGSPETAVQVVTAFGLSVLTVAEHLKPEEVYQFMVDLRSRHGVRLIPADGSLLEIYRALRRGEVVGIALDRDTTGSGADVMFLGAQAHLPDGYAKLVARTRAPLVVGLTRRLPDERVRFEVEPAYVPPEDASREDVYAQALEYGLQGLARAVTAHPEQWVLTTAVWDVKRET